MFTEAITRVMATNGGDEDPNALTLSNLPARKSVIRAISRERNRNTGLISDRTTDIPERLHRDRENNLFLLYDKGVDSNNGFLIFSS